MFSRGTTQVARKRAAYEVLSARGTRSEQTSDLNAVNTEASTRREAFGLRLGSDGLCRAESRAAHTKCRTLCSWFRNCL